MIQFALHVGIDKRGISFPPSPENIAGPSEGMGRFKSMLYLARRVGKDIGTWRGSRPLSVARMGKQAGRPPEQFLATAILGSFELLCHPLEIRMRLGPGRTLGRYIPVMEAVKIDLGLFQEFKKDGHRAPRHCPATHSRHPTA